MDDTGPDDTRSNGTRPDDTRPGDTRPDDTGIGVAGLGVAGLSVAGLSVAGLSVAGLGVAGIGEGASESAGLQVGLASRVELIVGDADTAQALGSGDVPVLGTPRLIALAEAATVAVTARRLDPGRTTVGTRIELDHQAATAIGRRVTVLAVLAEIDGRRLIFDIIAREGTEQIAEGRVERIIVDRRRFVAKALEATA